MSTIKKFLHLIFIDGLSGMALGLFSTLIIGTILKQIADLIGGDFGYYLGVFAVIAQRLTGAGIGIGVAYKYKSSTYVTLSAAAAGMIGAYATAIISGSILSDGALVYSGPGDPLSAFIAALAGIAIGSLPAGKTKLDLLITPAVTIITGGAAGIIVGSPVSAIMTKLGDVINWGTVQQPLIMGVVVSVIMGMVLTLPISSAALGIILGLTGPAAGAATIGCCCQMVGFAVASFRENGIGGLLYRHFHAAGSEYCQTSTDLDPGDSLICHPRAYRHQQMDWYDQQCHRKRYGHLRSGWTDHDMADNDRLRKSCFRSDQDPSVPFYPAGHCHPCLLRSHAQTQYDQKRRYGIVYLRGLA